jgi:hypothetical protein
MTQIDVEERIDLLTVASWTYPSGSPGVSLNMSEVNNAVMATA